MTSESFPEPAARVNGGSLGVGTGLLMLLREAMEALPGGAVIAVRTLDPAVVHDLPAWCRVMAHTYLGVKPSTDGPTYYFRKSELAAAAEAKPDWGVRVPLRPDGELHTRDWMAGRVADVPAEAPTTTGFAPRGAIVEAGAPAFDFSINSRDAVWAVEVADLYEQATANQWDASRDIPWHLLKPLPDPLERAVCQLMTFLTENEYSALYVPAKFLPRINPQFSEVVFFLSTQMMDEARHIEAFTKRALANGGGLQYSAASTQLSLKTLFDQHDFTTASFLLSVLGEGTFLDLLRFIQDYAPDPVTAEICRRARADETRHVHFGMAHVRYYLAQDPAHYEELRAAVRQRAAVMSSITEVSPRVQEALAVVAAGGLDPSRLAEGTRQVRVLMDEMHANRLKRLQVAGFTSEQADEISRLHTPNFM
ncbi:MAG TPA: sulfurtransferase TusA family protein [Gemmataceae bacterium]|jgi:TusA-related sulfurtransferase|nr:sulfurtransferase TusA family protein [Gemmataceae bacterium]